MIEGYNNKIPLYNGKSKSTSTVTPRFIYFGGEYFVGYDNIYKYSQTGSLIWSEFYNVGLTSSSGFGTQISGISSDYSGYVWTITYTTNPSTRYNLIKYDSDGQMLIYGTSSSRLYGIDIDTQNNIVVCGSDSGGKSVYEYDSNLQLLWSFGTSSRTHTSVKNISTGVIVTSSNGYVTKLSSSGVHQWSTSISASAILCCCEDSSGNIWVGGSVNGGVNVFKISSSGTLTSSYYMGPGTTDDVIGITSDTSGYVYVASNAYLYKIDSSGSIIWSKNPGSGVTYKRFLVFNDGFIYIQTNSSPSLKVYNTSGTQTQTLDMTFGDTINIQVK